MSIRIGVSYTDNPAEELAYLEMSMRAEEAGDTKLAAELLEKSKTFSLSEVRKDFEKRGLRFPSRSKISILNTTKQS